MKSKSNFLSKALIGTIATSVVASSCTNGGDSLVPIFEDENASAIKKGDLGEAVVKVSVNFTEEEKAYIMAIEDVVLRILDDREFAKEFAKDPDAILGKYGCGLDVEKTDELYAFIAALGDEDVRDCIQRKDLEGFLKICESRNLIKSANLLPFSGDNDNLLDMTRANVVNRTQNFFISVVAIAGVAVLVVAGVAVSVAVITDTALWTSRSVDVSEGGDKYMLSRNLDVLDLYILENGSEDIYVYTNDCIEGIINESMPFFQENFPEIFEKYSVEEFKNLLRINLVYYANEWFNMQK